MIPRRYDIGGWSWLPLPPRIIRLRSDGVFEPLDTRIFAMDIKADHAAGGALITLDMTTDPEANGLRRIGGTGLLPQIDRATMEATYAALCVAHGVRPGASASGVYDLRSVEADGYAAVPLEGRFIIHASAGRP